MTIDGSGHCITTAQDADNSIPQQIHLQSKEFQQRDAPFRFLNDDMRNRASGECKALAESARGSHFCIDKMIDYHFHHKKYVFAQTIIYTI